MNRIGAIGGAIGLFCAGVAIDLALSAIPFSVFIGLIVVVLLGISLRKWLRRAPASGARRTRPKRPSSTPSKTDEPSPRPSKALAKKMGLDG